jgi:predicted methyltransferase
MIFTRRTFVTAAAVSAAPALAFAQERDVVLSAAVGGGQRMADNRARDRFRHPAETLSFWGLKPGMTVVEILPGDSGYWTEILAPYLKATGGRYIATGKMPARFGEEAVFGKTEWVNTLGRGPLVAPGTADMVIVARNIHDFMWTPGLTERLLKDFNDALKPGGILAVEEHRADPRPQVKEARDGYVETKVMVDMVTKAGFKLAGQSEVNANPKDTKDHPFGVWTLPPTRRSAQPPAPADSKFDHAKYDAIGESDRMTLRFVKA